MNQYASIKASELGCVLDCDLQTGLTPSSGSPTDNTARINAYLAAATSTNPLRLIMDGASATTGIIGPAGGYWAIEGIGDGSGFYILSGSNSMAIRNHAAMTPFDPGGTAPAQAGPVILKNFYINGNRGNGTNGNSTSGFPQGIVGTVFYTGIDIISSAGGVLENLTFYNISAYVIRLGNVSNYQLRGIKNTLALYGANTDNIHIDGPANQVTISDCPNLEAGDDVITCNAPEGYSGNISNIFISNCYVAFGPDLFRCYGNGGCAVSNVLITNCSGSGLTVFGPFYLGGSSSSPERLTGFKASNCNFTTTSTQFAQIADSAGTLDFSDQLWYAPAGSVGAFVALAQAGITVSSIRISNCRIYRTSAGNTQCIGVAAVDTGTIKKLTINGLDIDNEQGESYSPIPYLIDMANLTITELVIEQLDSTLITALVNPVTGFTGIGSISGPGVLASGFQIPDSAMANNCPYISSTSGAHAGNPCIVINGTAKLFTTV